tara:strand:- start:137 stop:286 length:150 start_codon:yes stop_codon:yes gene_type:complete
MQALFDIIREALGVGSDAAIIGFALILWRIERRLYRVELHLWPKEGGRL